MKTSFFYFNIIYIFLCQKRGGGRKSGRDEEGKFPKKYIFEIRLSPIKSFKHLTLFFITFYNFTVVSTFFFF